MVAVWLKGAVMAFDQELARRVRDVVAEAGHEPVEKKMFGGLAFMHDGHMFCGVVKDALMVRLGTGAAEQALGRPHVRPMDFTGRTMKGMVFVDPGGTAADQELAGWVEQALAFVANLPAK
jgi:TfoX/Sxy family transcriptional regulator of competence genes